MPHRRPNPTHPGGGCPRSEPPLPPKWKRWVSAQRAQWRCGPRLSGRAAKHSCVTQTCAGDGFLERFLKTTDHTSVTEIYPTKGSCAGVNAHLAAPPPFPGCLVTWAWALTEFLKAPQTSPWRTEHFLSVPRLFRFLDASIGLDFNHSETSKHVTREDCYSCVSAAEGQTVHQTWNWDYKMFTPSWTITRTRFDWAPLKTGSIHRLYMSWRDLSSVFN